MFDEHYTLGVVQWGWQLCVNRCGQVADGLLDGQPLCAPCAGVIVERWAVTTIADARTLAQLPALWQRDENRRRR